MGDIHFTANGYSTTGRPIGLDRLVCTALLATCTMMKADLMTSHLELVKMSLLHRLPHSPGGHFRAVGVCNSALALSGLPALRLFANTDTLDHYLCSDPIPLVIAAVPESRPDRAIIIY